jgi:hypothetical protein
MEFNYPGNVRALHRVVEGQRTESTPVAGRIELGTAVATVGGHVISGIYILIS